MVTLRTDPDGFPIAPSTEAWEALSLDERAAVVAALSGKVTFVEASPPENTARATLLVMETHVELVKALLELPASDRIEFAFELLESLEGCNEPTEVENSWRCEIARRLQEIESGAVELEDGPTAMARLRDRVRARLARRGS
jgi:putative addiction module component (TIGR02574 family)